MIALLSYGFPPWTLDGTCTPVGMIRTRRAEPVVPETGRNSSPWSPWAATAST